MLQLEDVVKHYRVGDQETIRAVDGVSLSVGAGELVALYGPSGSGKTTLLMLIAGLLVPDRGSVIVNGREVSSLSERERAHYRRSELGFIRQSLDLIPGVRADDNAALKLFATSGRREAQREVAPLLERLGLNGRARQRAEQLSMGERQRVMIARALSTQPRLVLADEPTGSLDTDRGREVLTLLAEICHERQMGVLLVTHDPRAAAFADQVHALRDGQLVKYEPDRDYAPFHAK
jgi:putative ABC transport system ATP-binding protein